MSAHTPGPWRSVRYHRSSRVMAGDYHIVARCSEGELAEVEANAILIAAAPFLLSGLEHIANTSTDSRIVEFARAAIAKATQP